LTGTQTTLSLRPTPDIPFFFPQPSWDFQWLFLLLRRIHRHMKLAPLRVIPLPITDEYLQKLLYSLVELIFATFSKTTDISEIFGWLWFW
jgi:hypothetical protein